MAIGNLQELIPAIFTGPNGERLTPEQIAQRQAVAQSLLGRATDTSPDAGGWASVLTKGIMGGMAGYQQGRADDAAALNAKTDQENIEAGLGSIFGGGGQTPAGGIVGAFPPAVAQVASPTSGVATGTSLPPQLTPLAEGSEWLQYANQGATRNLPINEKLSSALSFLPEMGVTMRVVSGGQVGKGEKGGRVGSTRHDHGNAADVDFYIGDRKLTPKNEQDRAILAQIVQRGKAAGITGWGEGDDYMGSGRVHLGFGAPGVWGAGGKGANAPEWLTNAYNTPYTPQQAIQSIAPIEQGDENPAAGIAPIAQAGNAYVDPIVAANPYQEAGQVAPMAMTAESQAPQQPQIDPRLAALNDQMLGGALSPTGRSEVAQALTGYFPDAPSANRAPITAQNNAMSQAPMQQPTGGINPQIIASLLGPNSSPQARQVGALLLGQHQQQQAAMQAQQQAQQEIAQRQQIAQSMGIDPNAAMDAETWKAAVARANRDRSTVTVGNVVYDANTGQPVIEGQRDPTTDIQNYEYARQNGYGGSFADYQQEVKRAGATNVSTVVGGDSDEYRKEFEKSMGAATAKTFTDAMNAGDIARRSRINLDRISQLASSTPQGLEGAAIRTLGEYGIKTEGLDKVQAMESLISQMVPSQRPPGSGTISDADLALYKASLPRLINSPEGNSLILETLYAINDHDIAASDIAARVAAREITPTEARKLMRQIPNPFDDWREKVDVTSAGAPSGSKTKTGVTWSVN